MCATSYPFPATNSLSPDCRHYRGDKPCIANGLCDGCEQYAPYVSRICIIKLGALGDVVRTLCILPELRRQYPNSQITWITKPNAARMLKGHNDIDRLLVMDAMTALSLTHEQFDLMICLDKEPQPAGLAMSISATRKLGVGLSPFGTPIPLNPQAVSYFELGMSDELKFNQNTLTYPQLIYSAFGWEYKNQRYTLPLDQSERAKHVQCLTAKGWDASRPTLGINVGAGKVFANKMWPAEKQAALIQELQTQEPGIQVLLLGGPDERPIIDQIYRKLESKSDTQGIFDGGTQHQEPAFVALIDLCDVMFSGDTMAMHVAIALNKGVVASFGPTCQQEIALFGLGEKLVANVPCGPCYKRICDQSNVCLDAIKTDDAVAAIQRVLKQRLTRPDDKQNRELSLQVLPYRQVG
ncbi:MAG: glycosyltransferase family 9 protein [Phycisphaeraceae bacterium]|nr:glycosyltransferase family 9 protein [Phycisphaeraceae bacterium]